MSDEDLLCGCGCAHGVVPHDPAYDPDHDDSGYAANVDIGQDQTAAAAFAGIYPGLQDWTLAQMVDDLDDLSSWTVDRVTFSFPTEESPDYVGNSREGTLRVFADAQAEMAREVMAHFQDVIAIDLVDAGTDVDADIRLYNSTLGGTAGGAPAGEGTAGDVWIYNYDPNTVDDRNYDPGGYQHHLIIHEVGHTLGLSHSAFTGGDTYEDRATYAQNNHAWTAMSYLRAGTAGLDWDTTYAGTPMLADVAALQSVYGANMATRTGDTTYGFNATADRPAFDFDQLLEDHGRIAAITIWDAGGIDTLDLSGFDEDGFIDLRTGSHSSVGGHDLNVAIAEGAVIENATGGAGDDRLIGNDADNLLIGGEGADHLVGGAGDDVLFGDGGAA